MGTFSYRIYSGHEIFLLLVDNCSRVMFIYVFKNKTKVASVLMHFEAYAQRQFAIPIKTFQSNGGTGSKSLKFHWFPNGI